MKKTIIKELLKTIMAGLIIAGISFQINLDWVLFLLNFVIISIGVAIAVTFIELMYKYKSIKEEKNG